MRTGRALSVALVLSIALPAQAPGPGNGIGVRKIAQLIGDRDTTLRIDTLTQTKRLAGIGGTDLGSSFEHKGRLYLLFGDTWQGARDKPIASARINFLLER